MSNTYYDVKIMMLKKEGMNVMKKLLALRNSKRGFTLVEIIVVLVIIAILAAIAIPSLIGYIGKAKEKQILTEARAVYVASQAIASEEYADGEVEDTDITADKVNKLIGETYLTDGGEAGGDFVVTLDNGKVTGITFTRNGYTATYVNNAWSTVKV